MNININDVIYLVIMAGTILLLAFIPSRIIKILRKKYIGEITGKSTKEQLSKNRLFSVISIILIIPYGVFICPTVVYLAIILTELILKGNVDWR